MKFKLKRIDWYIIKQFLGTYIFAIALIIAISVVFDINEKIDQVPESGRTVESDCLRLLHELHPVFREPVQSVVYFHCRYLLHLKVSRQFRSDRNVGERDEFPASDVALRDFGRDHCTQYVCAERLYHSACQPPRVSTSKTNISRIRR